MTISLAAFHADEEACTVASTSSLLTSSPCRDRKVKLSTTAPQARPTSRRVGKQLCCLPTSGRSFLIGTLLAAAVIVEWSCSRAGMPRIDNLEGFTTSNFSKVEKLFRKNFHDGWEREGAAIAVYHKGELVVDLRGGYADRAAERLWTDQTRTVVFSTTKAMGALCVAMLVDRGHCRYEDRMAEYWPEFAQNGKENVTIECIMNHQAGLAALDEPISRELAVDSERMAEMIAKQKPNWIPGTKSGYHAVTYGWLVDQIIRRCDPLNRSIGIFFKEEIADKYGIDFHIGLPPSEEHTVSRLSMPSRIHLLREILHDPRVLIVLGIFNLQLPNSVGRKVRKNPRWFKLEQDVNTFNDPELHAMEQAAALGIGKARDIARLFSMVLCGDIISKDLLNRLKKPVISTGIDAIVMVPLPKGHGFLYERHPLGDNRWLFGHPGYGGSTVMMDPDEEVVIAYVSNGLKTGMGELTGTYRILRNAVFDSIEASRGK